MRRNRNNELFVLLITFSLSFCAENKKTSACAQQEPYDNPQRPLFRGNANLSQRTPKPLSYPPLLPTLASPQASAPCYQPEDDLGKISHLYPYTSGKKGEASRPPSYHSEWPEDVPDNIQEDNITPDVNEFPFKNQAMRKRETRREETRQRNDIPVQEESEEELFGFRNEPYTPVAHTHTAEKSDVLSLVGMRKTNPDLVQQCNRLSSILVTSNQQAAEVLETVASAPLDNYKPGPKTKLFNWLRTHLKIGNHHVLSETVVESARSGDQIDRKFEDLKKAAKAAAKISHAEKRLAKHIEEEERQFKEAAAKAERLQKAALAVQQRNLTSSYSEPSLRARSGSYALAKDSYGNGEPDGRPLSRRNTIQHIQRSLDAPLTVEKQMRNKRNITLSTGNLYPH